MFFFHHLQLPFDDEHVPTLFRKIKGKLKFPHTLSFVLSSGSKWSGEEDIFYGKGRYSYTHKVFSFNLCTTNWEKKNVLMARLELRD